MVHESVKVSRGKYAGLVGVVVRVKGARVLVKISGVWGGKAQELTRWFDVSAVEVQSNG